MAKKLKLGDCTCINEELARILEDVVERAMREAESFIKEPYGASRDVVDFYKKRLELLHSAEDAMKSLDICGQREEKR